MLHSICLHLLSLSQHLFDHFLAYTKSLMLCKNVIKLKEPKLVSVLNPVIKVVFNYELIIVPMRIISFQGGLSTLTT